MGSWLTGLLLLFYALVAGLAWYPPVRRRSRLLQYVHWGGWGISLLLLPLFLVTHLSLRGQWLESLPLGLAWLSGATYCWVQRRQLRGVKRLYYGCWLVWPAVLGVAYLIDSVLFILLSAPLWALAPTETVFAGPECTVRHATGLLASGVRVELVTPAALVLEKHHGTAWGETEQADNLDLLAKARSVQVLQTAADSSTVAVTSRAGRQYLLTFRR